MELIFVYNANSGLGNKLLDGLHKVIHPSSYECDLCAITYHAVGKRKTWRKFLKESKIPMRFMYRDTFQQEFLHDIELPAVLRYENSSFTRILDKKDFENLNDLTEFIVLLRSRVPEFKKE